MKRKIAGDFDTWVHDGETPVAQFILTGYEVATAGLKSRRPVRLVKPNQPRTVGLITDNGLGYMQAAPDIAASSLLNDALDRHGTRTQLLDRCHLGIILVAARIIVDQVTDGFEAKNGELLGLLLAYSFELSQRTVQCHT